uniref:DUF4872 domain-containing protein n=1 Tax=Nonomuraea lactucae TaxID=2249762 RepID=UPI000DE1E911
GRHHDASLLSRALVRAGVEGHGEALLAGLGGGIGFMYAVFEYRGHHPMTTVVAQAHPEPMIPRALERAGIGHEVRQSGSPRVARRALLETLDAGRTAICRVNRFALPWRPGFPFPDPLEVGVTGADGDTLLVDDEHTGPDELAIDAFMAAWSGLRKARHHLVAVTGPATADPALAVRDAVRDTVARLTGPVLGNSFDTNFGLSGMRKLAAQLADTTGRQGWARRFADPEAFFIAMTRLHDCLEIEYTAAGGTRPLYAEFLDEADTVLGGGTACAAAAPLYRQAGRLWSEVAATALSPASPEFARRRDLIRERRELLVTEGFHAADRLRALHEEDGSLPGRYGAADVLGPQGRAALLARLAELVARAVETEEAAVQALAEV